jgi:TonB family protein
LNEERIDLIVVEKRRAGGVGIAVAVSLVLHSLLIILFLRGYRPAVAAKDVPIARYVELMQQNPREFVEAPGPKLDQSPSPNAPLSDGNRRASGPEPSPELPPTNRPGEGGGPYTPPSSSAPPAQQPRPSINVPAQAPAAPATQLSESTATPSSDRLTYREPTQAASAAVGVDWKSAIKEVGKFASLGGGQGVDLSGLGGEKGSFEQGPLSFETQWYDWGDYAQSMVSKIRVNWYANMPQLIRTGMKGVVTIRFTIQRDGRLSDVTILSTSEVPPYDFAARKAIELSSPLQPLPKDFPNPSERVTAVFYYNATPPER